MGTGFADPITDNKVHKSEMTGPVRNAYEREADCIAEAAAASTYLKGRGSNSRINIRSAGQAVDSSYSLPLKESNFVSDTIKSSGRPLDESVRLPMESWFNRDFRDVRIHDDTRASESARAVKAIAYTVGSDIAFKNGSYAPDTYSGRMLIAHELTHVAQQEGHPVLQKKGDPGLHTEANSDLQLLNDNKALVEKIRRAVKGIDDRTVIKILKLPQDLRAQLLSNVGAFEKLNTVFNVNQFNMKSVYKKVTGDVFGWLKDDVKPVADKTAEEAWYTWFNVLDSITLIKLLTFVNNNTSIDVYNASFYNNEYFSPGDISSTLGFEYDKKQDIYYSKLNPWQRNFGYFDIYDESARYAGMVIDYQKILFNYDNRDWNIELWKGQYGFASGGEIGIYTGEYQAPLIGKEANDWLDFGTNTKCADDKDMLQMSFVLTKDNQVLFKRDSDNKDTKEIEKHWWITGFKPGVFSRKEQLVMEASITFKDASMAESFNKALVKISTISKVKRQGITISFTWSTLKK